ncbi:MAG: HNH endonuclease [Nitrososphaera sp.]|nr:HNH endonuclease [Nitrososphaera sp.]
MRPQRITTSVSQYPALRSLDNLDLKELTQLRRAFERYKIKQQEYENECDRVTAEFNRAKLAKEFELDALRCEKQALETKKHQLIESIRHLRAGALRSFFTGTTTTTYDGIGYHQKADSVISQIYPISSRLYEISRQLSHGLLFGPIMPREPRGNTSITVGGAKIIVSFKDWNERQIESLIRAKINSREIEKDKIRELRAKVATTNAEKRSQAQRFRRDLHKQLKLLGTCPYCGGTLTESNAHLDHIYPISKGGLSSSINLVFVCDRCNINKGDRTLRAFLKAFSFSEQFVYHHLELLQKDF